MRTLLHLTPGLSWFYSLTLEVWYSTCSASIMKRGTELFLLIIFPVVVFTLHFLSVFGPVFCLALASLFCEIHTKREIFIYILNFKMQRKLFPICIYIVDSLSPFDLCFSTAFVDQRWNFTGSKCSLCGCSAGSLAQQICSSFYPCGCPRWRNGVASYCSSPNIKALPDCLF